MIQVFGFGGAGTNTINYLRSKLGIGIEYVCVDLNKELINNAQQLINIDTKILLLTAGMGGKSGTDSIISYAKAGKEKNILIVAVVTMPFSYEGDDRKKHAQDSIKELQKYADTLIVLSNDKLRGLYGTLPFNEAFEKSDAVFLNIVQCINNLLSGNPEKTVLKDIETFIRHGNLDNENKVAEALRYAIATNEDIYYN